MRDGERGSSRNHLKEEGGHKTPIAAKRRREVITITSGKRGEPPGKVGTRTGKGRRKQI